MASWLNSTWYSFTFSNLATAIVRNRMMVVVVPGVVLMALLVARVIEKVKEEVAASAIAIVDQVYSKTECGTYRLSVKETQQDKSVRRETVGGQSRQHRSIDR